MKKRTDVLVDPETGALVIAKGPFGDSVKWKQAIRWERDGESWINTGEIKEAPDGTPLWSADVVGFDGAGHAIQLRLYSAAFEAPEVFV